MQVEHTHRDTILPVFLTQVVYAKSFFHSIFCTNLWEAEDTRLDLGQDEHLGWSRQLERSLAFFKQMEFQEKTCLCKLNRCMLNKASSDTGFK